MKMELIAALIHSPKILFLDEPTIGLDVVMQKKMRDFIKEYNRRFNATVILTSHYMDDVKELCKRVVVIDKGKILFDGALDEIIKKFANHKLITAIFSKPIDQKDLKSIGVVKEFDFPKAVISSQARQRLSGRRRTSAKLSCGRPKYRRASNRRYYPRGFHRSRSSVRKYWVVFQQSFQNEFVYRLNFILWRFRNVLRILMTYFLWHSVFLLTPTPLATRRSK